MSPIDERVTLHVAGRLPGLELSNGAAPERPLLSPSLCLVLCDDESAIVAPGRQPFPRLGHDQLLARTPTQVVPYLRRDGARARGRVLSIDMELLDSVAGERLRLPRFHSLLIDAPHVAERARQLCDAVELQSDANVERRLLHELVPMLVSGFAARVSRLPPLTLAVARARDLLHEHFADEVPLDGLARAVTMSKCHLVHLFHRELGLPPHAYQIQLRVAHARRLVVAGTPLAEVASLTGFADQSHLTRLFKRIVGVPPGQYAAGAHVVEPRAACG